MRAKLSALLLLSLSALALSSTVLAQDSPLGSWTTVDDKTGQPKSVVEIYEARDGNLAGRVSEILQSDSGPNPVCDQCSGDRQGKPIKGMVILWGMRKKGDAWEEGKILDPATGKVYSARVEPIEGGSKLEVRGFMGFSLLGRTQTWVRQ